MDTEDTKEPSQLHMEMRARGLLGREGRTNFRLLPPTPALAKSHVGLWSTEGIRSLLWHVSQCSCLLRPCCGQRGPQGAVWECWQ